MNNLRICLKSLSLRCLSHVVVDNFISDYGLECLKPRTLMENKFALERSSDFFLFASEKYENPKIEEISHAFSQLKRIVIAEFQNILRAITKRDVSLIHLLLVVDYTRC